MYTNLVNQLINSRANYIEVSYSQMVQSVFIQNDHKKKNNMYGDKNQKLPQVDLLFRQSTAILRWLQQSLQNEASILECSALGRKKYCEVLATVFGDRLPKRIAYRVQAQIEGLKELKKSQLPQGSMLGLGIEGKEHFWVYEFQLWNLLVTFHKFIMQQVFAKFEIADSLEDTGK